MLPPFLIEARRSSVVKGRRIAAAAPPPHDESCEFGSRRYFFLCACGGVLSCGSTHTMVVPLDLVKCRIQVDPAKYGNIRHGFGTTLREDGGMCKFGFYEYFKVFYGDLLGEEYAYLHRTYMYLAASATAEFIADVGLCPWESAKVKIQTAEGYARTLREAMPKMYAEEGLPAFYKSITPLWMRQIPYTMMKFTCFERTLEALYKYVVPKPRADCTKSEQLVVTFSAGYIAGVFCAIVSHPADTVVSKLNQQKGRGALEVVRGLGFFGIWKGLVARIIMIGTLTAAQWLIYDGFKVAMQMPRPPPPEMPESLRRKMR